MSNETELPGTGLVQERAFVTERREGVRETVGGREIVRAPEAAASGFTVLDRALRGELPLARNSQEANSTDSSAPMTEAGVAEAYSRLQRQTAIETAVANELVEDVAVLAAHQSKFTFDASFRDRRDIVGPQEWLVKAAYEWGVGTNVAKRLDEADAKGCAQNFRRAESLSDDLRASSSCSEAYAAAIKEAADDPDVKMGSRVTFALEYHELSAVDVVVPVAFNSKKSKSFVWSLAAGRDLLGENSVEKRGRIELSLSYDDVTDENAPDKARKDRMIGKLTYSQRINDKLDIPISLTYANHSDYLTNVDKKLNAHFGISYKLPDMKK